jgi:hypothetical protein
MREGHEWLAAEAQHDLFHFMTVRERFVEAELHARRALRWYPKHHPRFPLFVADVAFLLVCEQHYSAAAGLLSDVLQSVTHSGARAVITSLLARALAGSGRLKEYQRVRRAVVRSLTQPSEWEPAARWNLAEADRAAGQWDSAETNARAAVEAARARHDAETERFAVRLVGEIEKRVPPAGERSRNDEAFTNLIAALRSRLVEWAPTRRGRAPRITRKEWAA